MAEMSGVRVLERGIAVLSLLAGAEEPLGVSEIGRQTELSKATACNARLLSSIRTLNRSGGVAESGLRTASSSTSDNSCTRSNKRRAGCSCTHWQRGALSTCFKERRASR